MKHRAILANRILGFDEGQKTTKTECGQRVPVEAAVVQGRADCVECDQVVGTQTNFALEIAETEEEREFILSAPEGPVDLESVLADVIREEVVSEN